MHIFNWHNNYFLNMTLVYRVYIAVLFKHCALYDTLLYATTAHLVSFVLSRLPPLHYFIIGLVHVTQDTITFQ